MQNASHDLKILRVLRGISVFRRQTARYSLIGGWRCGDINSLSVEVLRWSTPQFTYVYVGSVSWAVRHQSAALLDGPGRMYAFSMQAESLGRKHHIIDIQWESWRGVVWKWLVHTTWRGMYTICYCEQECLGSGWGVDLATKCYTSTFQGITSPSWPWDSLKRVFCRWQQGATKLLSGVYFDGSWWRGHRHTTPGVVFEGFSSICAFGAQGPYVILVFCNCPRRRLQSAAKNDVHWSTAGTFSHIFSIDILQISWISKLCDLVICFIAEACEWLGLGQRQSS